MPLRIPTRIAAADLEEAVKLTQGWSYWPRRILVEKYGYTSLGFALCGLCVMIFRSKQYATTALALGTMASAVVGFGFLTLVAARRRASHRRKLRKFNQNTGTALVDEEGVLFEYASAQPLRVPWASYRRVLIGETCVVLFGARKLPFGARRLHILPVSMLTADQRVELRSLLHAHLGPERTQKP